jgi:hypothetical protein
VCKEPKAFRDRRVYKVRKEFKAHKVCKEPKATKDLMVLRDGL